MVRSLLLITALLAGMVIPDRGSSQSIADAAVCANPTLTTPERIAEFLKRGWLDQANSIPFAAFNQALDFLSVANGASASSDKALLDWVTQQAEKYGAARGGTVLRGGPLLVLVGVTDGGRNNCAFISANPYIDELAKTLKIERIETKGDKRSFRVNSQIGRWSAYEYPIALRPGLALKMDTAFAAYFIDEDTVASEVSP